MPYHEIFVRFPGKQLLDIFIMGLTINSNLVIPFKELKWRFSRSSGPGGQSVNKTNSRVVLIFDINRSCSIDPLRKNKLIEKLHNRLLNGCLIIVSAEERSQYQNRQLALARLSDILREGLQPPPKARRVTKPTRAIQRRRIEEKKRRGALKSKRQSKPAKDD